MRCEKPKKAVYQKIKENWDKVAKPLDGLGKFEHITAEIGAILGKENFSIKKRAVVAMCADNGVVEEGISQSGQEVSTIVTKFMGQMQSSVGKMAQVANCEVIVTDIGLAGNESISGVRNRKVRPGTRNFYQEPAMIKDEALCVIEIGIQTVEKAKEASFTILGTGEMGIGNTTTSSAMAAAMLRCPVEEVTGRGAGLCDAALERKKKIIQESIEKYNLLEESASELDILCCVGGLDIAGLVGVFLGGALYHVPIVIDGVISAVAALTADRMMPGCRDYMLASHNGKEPATGKILELLGKDAVIYGDLALGEGTGTVMLFALLDMAMALYESNTTFDEMRVTQYERYP